MTKGKETISKLTERLPQLYVAPAEGAQSAHRQAAGRGIIEPGANLEHFLTSDEDELREVSTPAGPIEVLFLAERQDFETFLQIVGHKAQPVPISRTVGAMTYIGLADWGAVAKARAEYEAAGGTQWAAEFGRLTKQPGTFRMQFIVISEGPYSNLSADETPYDSARWVIISREIRLHHECAHVVCRRTMPDVIAPVWDEVTADVTGLLCATGEYDAKLAAKFLGITPDGYAGGRLVEYLTEEQQERVDVIAREVYAVMSQVEQMTHEQGVGADDPFNFLLELKRNPLIDY